MHRRQFLLGTGSLLGGVAGCSALSSGSSMIDLTLFNQTDTPYTVEMDLFQADVQSRSDARVFAGRLDVPAGGETRRNEITEAEPLLIRYGAYEENSRLTDQDHSHYYPPGGDDSLTFDIQESGTVTRRNS